MGQRPGRGATVAVAVVAILAALVALVIWALSDAEPPPAPAPPPAPVAPPAPLQRTPPRVRPPRAAAEPAPAVVVAEAPAPRPVAAPEAKRLRRTVRVRVEVLRSGGSPAPGADVLALDPLASLLSPPGPAVRARKRADDAGRAEFEVAGGTTVLRIFASLDGESGATRAIDVAVGGDRDVDVHLGPALVVSCTTVDADDAPVAGAEVTLSVDDDEWPLTFSAQSGADGRAPIPPIPAPGPNAWLTWTARATGRAPATETGRQADAADVRLVLAPAVTVRGRVVDEAGKPVAGARVRVAGAASWAAVASRADGRFELTALPRDGGTLVASKDGFAPAVVRDLRGDAGDVDAGEVVLRVGGRLAGVVVDDRGAPVDAAVVELSHPASEEERRAATGLDGRFAFDHVADDDHDLVVNAPQTSGAWSTRRRTRETGVRPDRGDVRIVLDGRATVVLRFLNDADRTSVRVGSVKLTARAAGPTPTESAWAWSGADIEGVRFEPGHTGVFDVTIEVPGWLPGTVRGLEVVPDRETGIDVLFRRSE